MTEVRLLGDYLGTNLRKRESMYKSKFLMAVIVVGCVGLVASGCEDDPDIPYEMCTYYQECYPSDFAQEYTGLADCEADLQAGLTEVRQVYGTACYSAGAAYYSCVSSLSCTQDPDTACAVQADRAESECQGDVTAPCPNYVSGTDDDFCCQTHNPCDWENDEFCDCSNTCSWDSVDCTQPR